MVTLARPRKKRMPRRIAMAGIFACTGSARPQEGVRGATSAIRVLAANRVL